MQSTGSFIVDQLIFINQCYYMRPLINLCDNEYNLTKVQSSNSRRQKFDLIMAHILANVRSDVITRSVPIG